MYLLTTTTLLARTEFERNHPDHQQRELCKVWQSRIRFRRRIGRTHSSLRFECRGPQQRYSQLLIVATEHDSVYSFDADSGASIWHTSMLKSGENNFRYAQLRPGRPRDRCDSTPVIDRTRGANGVVYVIAMSKDGSGKYHQRLHALDLALGAELFSGPMEVQAKYPGTGDNSDGTNVIFDPDNTKSAPACC